MSKPQYAVPDCIKEKCDQARYARWLQRKTNAHVRRDRKRLGKRSYSVARYKKQIHSAVDAGGDRDYYTGELLNWAQISTYRNQDAIKGRKKYKKQFALLPTVDHTFDKRGRQKFVICSWRVNDAKSDLTVDEFYNVCRLVLRHRKRRKARKRDSKHRSHISA